MIFKKLQNVSICNSFRTCTKVFETRIIGSARKRLGQIFHTFYWFILQTQHVPDSNVIFQYTHIILARFDAHHERFCQLVDGTNVHNVGVAKIPKIQNHIAPIVHFGAPTIECLIVAPVSTLAAAAASNIASATAAAAVAAAANTYTAAAAAPAFAILQHAPAAAGAAGGGAAAVGHIHFAAQVDFV